MDAVATPSDVVVLKTKEFVSINEAAGIAGVSRRTIYNWVADKKIEYKRTVSGSIRIKASSLWLTGPED